jgi:hypothetical protein
VSASKRETALAALVAAVQAALVVPAVPNPPTVERDEVVPQALPAGGRVVIWDAGGEAVPILSPLRYAIELRADIEITVPGATRAARAARMDLLLAAICGALAANRTLGGAVEWTDVGVAEIDPDAVAGAAPVLAATVPLTLFFTADATPQG